MNLPERYKLTLGPLVPGSKYNNGHSHLVLRVYDGTKQRAVFYNVEAFRDINIDIEFGTILEDGETIRWSRMAPVRVASVEDNNGEF